MRRSGFTMVELIFVIIIIGILSVAALPKFGDIKDRAKVNNEYSALSSLDGAIEGAISFQQEDANNMAVLWHGQIPSANDSTAANYKKINQSKKVLSGIIKKGDTLKIVSFVDVNSDGELSSSAGTDANMTYDVLFIEGEASNHITGVRKEKDVVNKPDRNDIWVFNTSPTDINVTADNTNTAEMMLYPGELKLLDINGTSALKNVKVKRSDGNTNNFAIIAPTPVN